MSRVVSFGICALRASAVALVVLALSETVRADFPNAPEVDPGSISSALALLAGGGLLIADRIRRAVNAKKGL